METNNLNVEEMEEIKDVDHHCIVGYFCDNVTGQLEKHDVFYDSSQNEYYFDCEPLQYAGIHSRSLVIPEEKVCRYNNSPYFRSVVFSEYRFVQVGTFKLTGAIVYEYTPVEHDNDGKKQPREFIYDFERPKDFKYFFMSGDFSSDRIFIWFDKDKNSAEDLIDFDAKPYDADNDTEDDDIEFDEMHQIVVFPKKK
jgi:hypothetical protein